MLRSICGGAQRRDTTGDLQVALKLRLFQVAKIGQEAPLGPSNLHYIEHITTRVLLFIIVYLST